MKEFKTVHPIDFDLYDKDSQNVIYIEDNSDQLLTLDIKNVSETAIALDDLTAQSVSSTNCHYALRFRPETLSSTSLSGTNKMILSPASNITWEMSAPAKDASGMDVIYLKNKLSNVILGLGTIETLVFMNVGAEATQGARGTRVELKTEHQHFIDTPETKLKTNKEIHLSIINHRGKKEIPLHIGFVGDDTVLNDGNTSNKLGIRILNTLKKDTINPDRSNIRFMHSSDSTKRSKMIFSFDWTNTSDEWALGTPQNIKDITVAPISGWKIEETQQGEASEWILSPETTDVVLGGEQHFDIILNNIRTASPSGHTHYYIRYENIPGYWDGQEELIIKKQQIVEHNKNVGIGKIPINGYKLDVNGAINASSINTGNGNYEIRSIAQYYGNQNLRTTDIATFKRLISSNTGNTNALHITNTSTNYPTAWIRSNGEANAIYAENTSSSHASIYAKNGGNGVAIWGNTVNGNALNISNNTGTYPTAFIKNNGTGSAIYAENVSNSHTAIYAKNRGDNLAVYANTANGNAVYGENSSSLFPTFFARNHQNGGVWGATNGDYAEYFESLDKKEIPRGTSVVLVDGKIRPAKKGETPMGLISSSPMIVGNLYDEWPDKYLKDEFGCVKNHRIKKDKDRPKGIQDDTKYTKGDTENQGTVVQSNKSHKNEIPNREVIGKDGQEWIEQPVLNPKYDPSQKYITRAERPEWACVGLLGQLPLRKGQPVAPTWIKMKDLSKTTELWLVK